LLLSDKPFQGLIGGTGVGKTFFVPIWLYQNLIRYPGEEWIASSPTITQMKRTVVKSIYNFLKAHKVPFLFNKTDLTFDLGDRGIIYCISAQEPDRMQGIHAKGIVGDECGLFEKLWFDTAVQRVTMKDGMILFSSTPYGLNWLYHDVFLPGLKGEDDFIVVNPRSIDNPLYPVKNYKRAFKRLPLWKFKMMFQGMFTKPAGLIYPNFTTVKPFKIPESWFRVRGLDFGFNNPSAILYAAQSPTTERWYIYNEYKQSGHDLDDLDKLLKDDDSIIYADPSAAQSIDTLQNRGHHIVAGNNKVFAGLMKTHGGLKAQDVVIFDSLVHLKDELSLYQWAADKKGNMLDAPKKFNDHLVDCLRYIYFTLIAEGMTSAEYISTEDNAEELLQKHFSKGLTEQEIDDCFDY